MMEGRNRLIINGKVQEKLYIENSHKYGTGSVDVVMADVVGSSRKIFKRVSKDGGEITIPVIYRNRFNDELKNYEEIVEEIKEIVKFGSEEVLEVGFTDVEYHERGYFVGRIEIDSNDARPLFVQFNLTFRLTEPYKYFNTVSESELEGDVFNVENRDDEVSPIIKLEASESSRYVNIYNSKNNKMLKIGDEGTGETKREELSMYKASGLVGLENKSGAGNHINYEDGILQPVFDSVGGNVRYEHVFSKVLQDFTSKITFRTMGLKPGQIGTSYIRMYNQDNEEILSLEMKVDPNVTNLNLRNKAHLVYKVRNSQGNGTVKLLEFSGDNYNNVFDNADLSVRLTRTGNTYTLNTWKYSLRDGTLTGRHSQSYRDSDGIKYSGDEVVKFAIGFEKRVGTPTPRLGISDLEVIEVINGNSSHYDVVKSGDELVIDNDKRLITRNGEPINYYKDVTSEYITLGTGSNEVSIYPEGNFEGEITYRERKL